MHYLKHIPSGSLSVEEQNSRWKLICLLLLTLLIISVISLWQNRVNNKAVITSENLSLFNPDIFVDLQGSVDPEVVLSGAFKAVVYDVNENSDLPHVMVNAAGLAFPYHHIIKQGFFRKEVILSLAENPTTELTNLSEPQIEFVIVLTDQWQHVAGVITFASDHNVIYLYNSQGKFVKRWRYQQVESQMNQQGTVKNTVQPERIRDLVLSSVKGNPVPQQVR